MFRPRLLRTALPRFSLSQSRYMHHVPPMERFQGGIDNLMTENGFQIAWHEYQGLMLEKLNAFTIDTEDYNSTPLKILLKYARQPSMAAIFNYASMAHNNHFFFDGLSNEPSNCPDTLQTTLERDFGSMDTLKKEFVAIGNSMFGPGHVWLVKTNDGFYKLLNTYIAGSPYPGAHFRRQAKDMNTEFESSTPAEYTRRQVMQDSAPANTVGSHGPLSGSFATKSAPGGAGLSPVLCLSTWAHVYLPDWGVLQKKEFIEAWWEKINWDVVATRAGSEPRQFL